MARKSPAPSGLSLSKSAPSPRVAVILGPSHSGKTQQLVDHYRVALKATQSAGLDRVLWLAPSSRSVAAVRDLVVAHDFEACLAPGIMTFDALADAILLAANVRVRPVAPVMQRDRWQRVIATALGAGALKHFADAARRPGFADGLAEHIRELKRHDIAPSAYEKITAARGQPSGRRELARLYTAYEQLLKSHALADRESAHSLAREALASGACQKFQELDLIVADAFTDFTRVQHETLRLLAARSQQLLIALPDDVQEPAPPRADLFAKTAATVAELRQYYPALEIRRVPPRPTNWPAADYLADAIFRHPKPGASAAALAGLDHIEIVEAAGAQDEIVQLARRIKEQLAFGEKKGTGPFLGARDQALRLNSKMDQTPFSPSDIVVVFRSVNDVAPRIDEVFGQFGIPYAIETSHRITASPLFRTLVSLLRLDQEDWPFRRVVSTVTNNSLAALSDAARIAAEWLVRDLQIASGRQQLLETVTRLAALKDTEAQLGEHQTKRVKAASEALTAISTIAAALDELPQQATLREWIVAIEAFAIALAGPLFASDAAVWQTIITNLTCLERLDAWLAGPPRKLSRSELLITLVDVASREALPHSYAEAGRVRVLSAPAARAVPARHLYLAGMSEKSFPAADRIGRIATDADYRFLANAAHQKAETANSPSVSEPTRAQDEMLLFYELLSRAQETLTISYAALDEKAQDLPPSPYVVELKRMVEEAGGRIHCTPPQLLPVPNSRSAEPRPTDVAEPNECRSARGTYSLPDWRIRAVAKAIESDGDRRLLAGIFSSAGTKPVGQAIDAGIRIVHARAHGDQFGPNEGVLASPAVSARLALRFGPKHLWSPSQWETYAACPFKFFLHVVLKLEPLGDLALETDYTRRGSRLHHVLAAFHRQWPNERSKKPPSTDDEQAQFTAHLNRVIDECIAASPDGGIDAALLELDRRQILKWAEGHFEHHQKYDRAIDKLGAAMSPAHLEFRFGSSRPDDANADPNSTSTIFELTISGEPIRVTGQIDRIDVGTVDGQPVFNVIDYKSGRKSSLKTAQIETGEQIQLPIYVEAAQLLLFEGKAQPLAAGYWSMGTGFDEKGALAARKKDEPGPDWSATQKLVHALIREFVDGIRGGAFPVASRDDKCTSFCDFSLTCRIAQARNTGKLWWPVDSDSSNTLQPAPASDNPQSEIRNSKS